MPYSEICRSLMLSYFERPLSSEMLQTLHEMAARVSECKSLFNESLNMCSTMLVLVSKRLQTAWFSATAFDVNYSVNSCVASSWLARACSIRSQTEVGLSWILLPSKKILSTTSFGSEHTCTIIQRTSFIMFFSI